MCAVLSSVPVSRNDLWCPVASTGGPHPSYSDSSSRVTELSAETDTYKLQLIFTPANSSMSPMSLNYSKLSCFICGKMSWFSIMINPKSRVKRCQNNVLLKESKLKYLLPSATHSNNIVQKYLNLNLNIWKMLIVQHDTHDPWHCHVTRDTRPLKSSRGPWHFRRQECSLEMRSECDWSRTKTTPSFCSNKDSPLSSPAGQSAGGGGGEGWVRSR